MTHVHDATVAAIDMETHALAKIATGQMPCALAVDANTGKVFVANYGDGSVTVVDISRGAVAGTVRVSGHPQAIAVVQRRS